MTETGHSADRMRQRLEAATKALPKIKIDADSTEAERKFAELRRELESLSGKKIGIDVSSEEAHAEIQRIERELQQLQMTEVDVNVRADIGEALAKLRTVDHEVSKVNGRTARVNVDADVGGALMGIGMVAGALASLPAVTTVAVGVGALGAAFTAAGVGAAGMAAVAVPSLGRINEALRQQETAAGGAGGAVKSAAQSAAEAAQRSLQLEQAERRVTDAKKTAKQAEQDLTQARRDARQAAEELTRAVRDQALSEEDAALSVREAEARLAEVMADPESTGLQRERAELSYRQALARLDNETVRTKELAAEKRKSDKAGVEGSDQVRAAKDKLKKANDDLKIAEQQLKVLQLQQKAAMQQTGGAAGGAASKMAELTKAEQQLAKELKIFKDEYEDWQKSLQGDVFPAISGGLDLVRAALPKISPLVKTASKSFVDLEKDAKAALEGPFWTQFLFNLNTHMPTAVEGLGHIFGNTFHGMAGVLDAFLPHTDSVISSLETGTKRFADWGEQLKNNPGFKAFVEYAKENAPKVGELLGNVATAVGNILTAGADAGSTTLDILIDISAKLRDLSPEQIQAIALGIAAVMAAAKLGATLKLGAFALLADLLSDMSPGQIKALALAIGAVFLAVKGYQAISGAADMLKTFRGRISDVGEAASGAKGKLATFGKVAAGLTIAAVGLDAIGSGINALKGQSQGIDKLTRAMQELGDTGKFTGDLMSQWPESTWHGFETSMENFADGVRETLTPTFWEKYLHHPVSEFAAILPGIDSTIDRLEQKFSDMDTVLANMVESGNGEKAAKAFEELARQAKEAGVPADQLKTLFPEYTLAVGQAERATADAAKAIGDAKTKLDDFKSSMSEFTSRTDFASAVETLKGKYVDMRKALQDANGTLDISKAKTDEQRNAVITAREKFGDLIGSVRELADKQKDLGGTAEDVRGAVLDQVGALLKLAGKSKDAKDLVYDLARNFGITKTEADKAKGGVKDVKEALDKLRNKQVKVTADTSQAENAIKTLINKYNGYKIVTQVDTKTGRSTTSYIKEEAGGVLAYAAGGIEAYATGGRRSTPPQVAANPTILFGEGKGREYFIPTDPTYRSRAVTFLEQAAGEFGMQVVPVLDRLASRATVPTVTADGGRGEVMVSLDNLEPLSRGVDDTGRVVSRAVTDAAAETAGAADQLAGTVGGALDGLSGPIGALSGSIDRLASSVDRLAGSAAGAGPGSSTPSSGPMSTATAAKVGKAMAANAKKLLPTPRPKGGLIEGSGPDAAPAPVMVTLQPMADGGLVTSPTILAGEAGAEMVIPLERRARGAELLGQAASRLGYTVLPSRSLTEPRYVTGGGGGGQAAALEERFIRRLETLVERMTGGAPGPSGGVTVNMPDAVIREEADVYRIGAEFGFNLRDRG
ncbi:coiled-coil domain-containing protein [Sphaerimonospora thailandensis]|nr:hypothetical protein [Sphaerimonospora thailandensis]